MDENELRQLAERVRLELLELIPDEDERARVDGDLARALDEPAGSAERTLRDALRSHDAVRRFLAFDIDRAVGPLGDPQFPLGVLYVCPMKNYAVVREVPSDEVLLCPKDGSVLERYDG